MTPANLVVLDFSGTLSPGATRFGTPGRIADALRRSGLADLRFADPDAFWQVLVNPTWERGSTTRAGYATVLTDAAVAHLRERGDRPVDRAAIATAAQRFTERYLAASTISPAWHPWLQRLAALDHTTLVVATDHYAEATEHIVGELCTAGIPAVALGGAASVPGRTADRGVALVANSADLGHHKQTRPFWAAVGQAVGPIVRVVVVDDFGANEPDADAYSERDRVTRRREATVALLTDVFGATAVTIPLTHAGDGDLQHAVNDVGRAAVASLTGVDTPPATGDEH